MKSQNPVLTKMCKALKSYLSNPKNLTSFDNNYRQGPSLYFYQKLLKKRQNKNIETFMNDDRNIELIYATLTAWDMNCRGAKLKPFEEFKGNIKSNILKFIELEKHLNKGNEEDILKTLQEIYKSTQLLDNQSKLVSNAKFFHFLFPSFLMPVDKRHTLQYIYNNSVESWNKYKNIIRASWKCINDNELWKNYNSPNETTIWNTTRAKMVDNAIIWKKNLARKNYQN